MEFNFDNYQPIYKQLIEQIKIGILTGIYPCGEKLPSVRELALITKVNPNTIQRALTELEDNELIITKRTSGKFVTSNEKKITIMRNEQADKLIEKFLNDSKKLGIEYQEIIKMIVKKGENYESNWI